MPFVSPRPPDLRDSPHELFPKICRWSLHCATARRRSNRENRENRSNPMKNNIIKTVAVLLLAGGSAFAADSGNIVIQGTVAAVNEIVVTPVAGYNTLNLTAGATDQQVATVNEKNNDPDGYTVTLTSLNASGAQAFLA